MSKNVKTLDGITLSPKAADPVSAVEGEIYRSDGSARSEGVHEFKNGAHSRIGRLRKIDMDVNGPYADSGAQDNILSEAIPDELDGATLLSAKLALFSTGSSGNTEIDIRLVRGASAPVTIYSVKPILNNATATDITSTGATTESAGTLSTTVFQAGDYLILDIKQVPDTTAAGFKVTLTFDE